MSTLVGKLPGLFLISALCLAPSAFPWQRYENGERQAGKEQCKGWTMPNVSVEWLQCLMGYQGGKK